MLLSSMRKHAQSWIIKFLIAIIILVFIFFFGYSFNSEDSAKIAEVNGESIGRIQYDKAYRDLLRNLQNEYQSVWSDKLIDAFDLKNRALETLIEQKIISQEAEKLGLKVTKDEVREKIFEITAFLTDGRFDENKYRILLSNNRMTPENFEETVSMELLQQKLLQFLTTFIVPSSQDVLDKYRYANEKVKLGFVKFSPDEFKDSVNKDKESVEKFFEERKEDYRIPTKIKVGYIKIDADKFSDKVEISEDELTAYYEDNINMFTEEEQIKARHILFRVPSDATPEEQLKVEEKAKTVLEKAKKGDDFAELATEFSEGPTKTKGGDLGYFTRGSMVKDFEEPAFNLKKDEVSDLVKTSYGYHIIKVEDIKGKSVKNITEVRDQIDSTIRRNRSMDMANEKALDLIDQMSYDIDLKEYAAEHEVSFSSTEFFPRSEPIPIMRSNAKLIETLFTIEKGDVTELVELNNEFYIMQVSEKKSSYLPELDEVYAAVEVDYVDYMALENAKSEAEKYLQALNEGNEWEAFSKEKNMEIQLTSFFSRTGVPSKMGNAPGLQEAVFKLDADAPYPEKVFENEKGAFVVKWEEKKDIDEAKFNDEKERYAESLAQREQQKVFMSWLDSMKAKSDIDRSGFKQYQ